MEIGLIETNTIIKKKSYNLNLYILSSLILPLTIRNYISTNLYFIRFFMLVCLCQSLLSNRTTTA